MERDRSGEAAEFVPVGSRRPKTTRFSPTPNSDETGTGRNDTAEPAGPTADALGAAGEPADPLQAATATRAPTTRVARRVGRCMGTAYGRPLTRAFRGGEPRRGGR